MHQDEFAKWLIHYIHKHYDDVNVSIDNIGNIYCVKGEADLYPCVVSHIDINQDYRENMKVFKNDKWVYAMNMDTGLQCGPGHDDKSGVFMCLEMIKQFDVIKAVFFRDEEVGCVGSSNSHAPFFYDCTMILQQDRNAYAGAELITYTNGIEICSKEFLDNAAELMDKFGYSKGSGTCTDVGAIKKLSGVDCVAMNMCAAYYDEHTDREVLSVHAFENAINFAYELIKELGYKHKWGHVPVKEKVKTNYNSYNKGYWDPTERKWKNYHDDYEDYSDVYYGKSYANATAKTEKSSSVVVVPPKFDTPSTNKVNTVAPVVKLPFPEEEKKSSETHPYYDWETNTMYNASVENDEPSIADTIYDIDNLDPWEEALLEDAGYISSIRNNKNKNLPPFELEQMEIEVDGEAFTIMEYYIRDKNECGIDICDDSMTSLIQIPNISITPLTDFDSEKERKELGKILKNFIKKYIRIDDPKIPIVAIGDGPIM